MFVTILERHIHIRITATAKTVLKTEATEKEGIHISAEGRRLFFKTICGNKTCHSRKTRKLIQQH